MELTGGISKNVWLKVRRYLTTNPGDFQPQTEGVTWQTDWFLEKAMKPQTLDIDNKFIGGSWNMTRKNQAAVVLLSWGNHNRIFFHGDNMVELIDGGFKWGLIKVGHTKQPNRHGWLRFKTKDCRAKPATIHCVHVLSTFNSFLSPSP